MTDRDEIARWPSPRSPAVRPAAPIQATKTPDQPGWFGNGDCTTLIRQETTPHGTEYVMLDADGPGAVVRFWMTFFGSAPAKVSCAFTRTATANPSPRGRARSLIVAAPARSGPWVVDGASTLLTRCTRD